MPFGLCNAPAIFQRCMLSLFSNMVEHFLEIFMDDFSIYGDSFVQCLHHLDGSVKMQEKEPNSELGEMSLHGEAEDCLRP